MDINKIKAVPEKYIRSVHLTIRVSPDIKEWLIKNQFSPTAIFNEAIKDLGYQESVADVWSEEDIKQLEKDSKEQPPGEIISQDGIYYKTVRVKTKDGWKEVRIQQYAPKREHWHGKGDIRAQRERYGRRRYRR